MIAENKRREEGKTLFAGIYTIFHFGFIFSDNFPYMLKVHKIEIFFGFDFEICIISLLVMSNY
jgi:hypothetical protein